MYPPPMKLISLNVGLPREMCWQGRPMHTAIYKDPVAGPRLANSHGIEGDGQADPEHHGGELKAVYAYAAEHYPFWRDELPGIELPWGAFGENLSTEGLLEEDARIGSRYRVGEALLRVTQPREPCHKLVLRLGDPTIVKRFLKSLRSGIYFAVEEPGYLGEGDAIELVDRPQHDVTVHDLARFVAGEADRELLERCAAVEELPEKKRAEIRDALTRE